MDYLSPRLFKQIYREIEFLLYWLQDLKDLKDCRKIKIFFFYI